ncbi:aspartic protease pepA [Penicillium atrosanguineum]|nr:aspartic protease pepA [Penicillium atrosanguineum]
MKWSTVKYAYAVAILNGWATSASPLMSRGRFSLPTFKGPKNDLAARSIGSTPSSATTNFLNITLGDHQTFLMEIDTGSSALWLFTTTNTPANETNGHPLYNPDDSSTYANADGYHFDIEYADGTGLSGPVGTEDVTIGGITVQSQYIGVPDDVRTDPNVLQAGCLGMAPNPFTMTPGDQKTWHQNAEPMLDEPLWTVDFRSDRPGSMDFGYIDSSKYTGEISYVPATSRVEHGDSLIGGLLNMIADTGTPATTLPVGVTDYYYSNIDGSSRDPSDDTAYIIPCDSSPPDLTLGFDGGSVTIPGSQINQGTVDGGCRGALYITTSGGNLGSAMFDSNFVVYSQTNARIGFAPKSN